MKTKTRPLPKALSSAALCALVAPAVGAETIVYARYDREGAISTHLYQDRLNEVD